MRDCPAHQMTVTLLTYIITRLVRDFEAIENRDPILEFVDEYTISTRSKIGFKIALRPCQVRSRALHDRGASAWDDGD